VSGHVNLQVCTGMGGQYGMGIVYSIVL